MESNINFKNSAGDPPLPSLPSLPRQSSIYSLTFDEFQSTVGGIGKDYGSMNMEELIKSIWSAEDVQNMGPTIGNNMNGNDINQESSSFPTRQGSLTLPRTLSQKTVEEVWRDMAKEFSNNGPPSAKDKNIAFGAPSREPTLGEVTLEEFLVRAQVVREDPIAPTKGLGYGFEGKATFGSMDGPRSKPEILPKPPSMAYGSALEVPNNHGLRGVGISSAAVVEGLALPSNGLVGLGGNGAVTVASNSPVLSSDTFARNGNNINGGENSLSSLSPVPCVFSSGLRGRKSAPLEKVIERRQRRMIKNRESAARSRARKQAYTTELEEEVARLKEENEEMRKKQAQMIEEQKNQAIELMRQQNGAKRRCLRRTQTALW